MRDFYRTYENHSALLSRAMKLGWIQNVVIMEADLTMELREWYMKAAKQFDWSKTELIAQIAAQAHEEIALAIEEVCYVESQEKHIDKTYGVTKAIKYNLQQLILRCQRLCVKGGRRRWRTISCPIYTEKQIAFMRC